MPNRSQDRRPKHVRDIGLGSRNFSDIVADIAYGGKDMMIDRLIARSLLDDPDIQRVFKRRWEDREAQQADRREFLERLDRASERCYRILNASVLERMGLYETQTFPFDLPLEPMDTERDDIVLSEGRYVNRCEEYDQSNGNEAHVEFGGWTMDYVGLRGGMSRPLLAVEMKISPSAWMLQHGVLEIQRRIQRALKSESETVADIRSDRTKDEALRVLRGEVERMERKIDENNMTIQALRQELKVGPEGSNER